MVIKHKLARVIKTGCNMFASVGGINIGYLTPGTKVSIIGTQGVQDEDGVLWKYVRETPTRAGWVNSAKIGVMK